MSVRSIRPRQSPLFSSYRPRRPSPLIIAWTVSADTRLICKRKTNARNASATDRPNWTGSDSTNLFRGTKKKKKKGNSLDDLSFFFLLFLFLSFLVHYARGWTFLFNFRGNRGKRRLICIILVLRGNDSSELIISISRILAVGIEGFRKAGRIIDIGNFFQ